MSLIKCPECGKEVSNTAKACPNCGYGIKAHFDNVKVLDTNNIKPHDVLNKNKIHIPNKKKITSIALICIIILTGVFYFINRPSGLEKNAKNHIKKLESIIGDIDVIDAVCFSIKSKDEKPSFRYLIHYNQNGKEDFALFFDDPYVG